MPTWDQTDVFRRDLAALTPTQRATFSFAESVITGEAYIVWCRIGTHDVLRRP